MRPFVHPTLATMLSRTNQNGPVVPYIGTPCWLWTRSKNDSGYGRCYVGNRVYRLAHRVVWELANGPIPAGMCVCHSCDTRSCIRPDHLFLGTPIENNDDKVRKGRGYRIPPGRFFGTDSGSAKLSNEQVVELRLSYNTGAETAALARKYNICPDSVLRLARGIGYPDADPLAGKPRRMPCRDDRRGERNAMCKLSEDDVRSIFAQVHAGRSAASIAREFAVSAPYVRQIARGEKWAHLSLRASVLA